MCLQRGIVASGEHAGKEVVKVSERFFRPAEVELLLGDPTKAKEVLGWDADKQTSVDKLCEEMVDSDIEMAKMEMARNDLRKKLKVRAAAPISRLNCMCGSTSAKPTCCCQQYRSSPLFWRERIVCCLRSAPR
jgi:hypothetical protein